MKQPWHETPEFQAQRRVWAKKLKESGFRDIEQVVDEKGTVGNLLLGVSAGDLNRKKGRQYMSSQEEYFTLCRGHVHTMKVGVPRIIWKLHSEGGTYASISRSLTGLCGATIGIRRVKNVVLKEKDLMLADVTKRAQRDKNE